MPTVSETDIDSILRISGMAVECTVETEFPPALFGQMTELFGSKSCVYYSMSADLDNHPIWDGVGYNLNGKRVQEYEDHYRALDPCFAGLRHRAATGGPLIVSTDQVATNERSYVDSGYYRDFLLPQHIHNSIIFAVNDRYGMLGLFGFHRAAGKPAYGADEHLKARLFGSQIASALRIRSENDRHLRTRALAKKLMERAGIVDYVVMDTRWTLVDSSGDAVQRLLGLSGGVRIVGESGGRVLSYLPGYVKQHLEDLVARYSDGRAVTPTSSDQPRVFDDIPGWPRVLVDVLALDASPPLLLVALLDERHGALSESKFADFGLTPREREVARKASCGLTTTQIADQLRISRKTVEHHLDHIFRKTGTHNRTALIYRLSA